MKNTILVVDDDKTNLALAQKILMPRYRIAASNSGRGALKYLENHRPELILLDINMPDMDGYEVMEQIRAKEETKTIPVIFLTADNLAETEIKCFQMGAMDFVTKPFVPDILFSRVDKTIELDQYRHNLENMVKEQAEKITEDARRISKIQDSVIVGMANLIESRDGSTGKHVKNTQMYVRMIANELRRRNLFAQELTEEYIEDLCKAAPLHDVGKIKIPDAILQKPGRLTPEEFDTMKQHTTHSSTIIKMIIGDVEDEHYVGIVEDIAMYHHERWDGTGYPTGLKEEEIPLAARIMAVADVFDALYEERCYKPPVRPIERIMQIMQEGRGTQFDPVIIDVFMEMLPMLKEVLGIS
ncbi:MAG: response regulator [Lachnospiraceae bacterium]|nr:response regulator [Lachnospiraceae bacterium]MBD5502409.1 response regulator [Lachnospiraceae bacterium]MBD5506079.1 response regulator [Lachnospiraceae bacterium]